MQSYANYNNPREIRKTVKIETYPSSSILFQREEGKENRKAHFLSILFYCSTLGISGKIICESSKHLLLTALQSFPTVRTFRRVKGKGM